MRRYAIVPSRGCYGSGDTVRPIGTSDDLDRARRRTASATREYRDAMRQHGGSSGGYRVVETGAGQWLGDDIDRTPDAT